MRIVSGWPGGRRTVTTIRHSPGRWSRRPISCSTEECNFYHSCGIVATPYVRAGKLVLNAEYTADWGRHLPRDLARFCPADLAQGIDGTLFTTSLAGQRNPCR